VADSQDMLKIHRTLNVKDHTEDVALQKKWEHSGISSATKIKRKIILPNPTIDFFLRVLI
jgi:hypothetical protein